MNDQYGSSLFLLYLVLLRNAKWLDYLWICHFAACCYKGSGVQSNSCLFFAPALPIAAIFAPSPNSSIYNWFALCPFVFYTARFFVITDWLKPTGFTSTSRSLQIVTHATSPLFTCTLSLSILKQSLKAEEGVEGYGGLEGLEGCEGLVLRAWLRSWTGACVLGQHSRVSVQVTVHGSLPVALVC